MSSGSSKRPGGARWENETGCTPGLVHGHAAAQQKSKIQLRARDLSPRNKATWSRPFAPERAGACKNLQDVPKQASTIDLDGQDVGEPTPIFRGRLRSAAIGIGLSRRRPRVRVPSTPPTILQQLNGFPFAAGACLQTGRSPRDASLCKTGSKWGRETTSISLTWCTGLREVLGPADCRSPAASCGRNCRRPRNRGIRSRSSDVGAESPRRDTN